MEVLIPIFPEKPKELAKKLKRKLRNIRKESQIPPSNVSYEYNPEFLREMAWLSIELERVVWIDGYIKNRFITIVGYTVDLPDPALKRTA